MFFVLRVNVVLHGVGFIFGTVLMLACLPRTRQVLHIFWRGLQARQDLVLSHGVRVGKGLLIVILCTWLARLGGGKSVYHGRPRLFTMAWFTDASPQLVHEGGRGTGRGGGWERTV